MATSEYNMMISYEFEGISQDGNFVEGVIEAPDRVQAMKLLIGKHAIAPRYLCEERADSGEKKYMRSGGMEELFGKLTPEERQFLKQRSAGQVLLEEHLRHAIAAGESLIAEAEAFLASHPDIGADAAFQLKSLINNLREAQRGENFNKLQPLMTGLKRVLHKLKKSAGEIMDPALQKFFASIKDEGDFAMYAQQLRTMPGIKFRLFSFEFRRLFSFRDRSNAWAKIKIILKNGKLFYREKHHAGWVELHRFLGALFFFYLVLFGISYYLSAKNTGITLLWLQGMTRNALVLQLVIAVFLVYSALTFKLHFLPASKAANTFLVLAAIVLGAGMLFW